MTLVETLDALGHKLPDVPQPVANYLTYREGDRLVVIAGQIGSPGRGAGLELKEARIEAELAALKVLAVLNAAVGGDLSRVHRVLRLGVFVAANADFTQHGQVADGASELIVAALGEPGRHARSAVGVASLPRGAAVELEAMVLLKS